MNHENLKERTQTQQAEREKEFQVSMFGDEIQIDGLTLKLEENFKDAFDESQLAIRYTPLLKQYDYIVGDLSADQLRLRGFYQEDRQVTADQKITALADYLYEYVNFGAPYFVLSNNAPAFRSVKVYDYLTEWEQEMAKSGSSKERSKGNANKSQNQSKNRNQRKKPANQRQSKRSNNGQSHPNNAKKRPHQFTTKKRQSDENQAQSRQQKKNQNRRNAGRAGVKKDKFDSNQKGTKQPGNKGSKNSANNVGKKRQSKSQNSTSQKKQESPKQQRNNQNKKRTFTIKERK